MKKIQLLLKSLSGYFNWIAAAAIVLIMMITVLDVIFRMLKIPVSGAYDLISLFGSVAISFSLAYTSVEKGHIAVDFLFNKFSDRAQSVVSSINNLIGAIFFLIVGWQSWVLAESLKKSGEVSMTIQLPTYPFVAGLAVSSVLLGFILFMDFIFSSKGILKK